MRTPSEEYRKYLESDAWKRRREDAIHRADDRCQICYVSQRKARLDVHHRTYVRFGHEDNMDLTVLCVRCHELFHSRFRVQKTPSKLEQLGASHGDMLDQNGKVRTATGAYTYEEAKALRDGIGMV